MHDYDHHHRWAVDEYGFPIRRKCDVDRDLLRSGPPRTKQSHPYNYDPFTIWGEPGPPKEANGSMYVDRMEEWDYSKYQRLIQKHYVGARPFDSYHCRGDLIEAFLRDWCDDPELKLLRVIECCNQSTGYPTWCLVYKTSKT